MNLSFLGGYLWVVQVLFLIGVTVFYFLGKKQKKEGFTPNYWWFCAGCIGGFIGSLIWMYIERQ